MTTELDLRSSRARKARLAKQFGPTAAKIYGLLAVLLILGGAYCLTVGHAERPGYFVLAIAAALTVVLLWNHYDLQKLPPNSGGNRLDDIMEPKLLASLKKPFSPAHTWQLIVNTPEAVFLGNHLLIPPDTSSEGLSPNEADMAVIWQQALVLHERSDYPLLHAGTLAMALMLTSPKVTAFMTSMKLQPADAIETLDWLDRLLDYMHQARPNFGGIGRDWATGFTPTLEEFSENISLGVQASGGLMHYVAHRDLLDGVVSSLERGNGVALVAPSGAGKSSLVEALAERLLEGRDPNLQYYQVVSLNASVILSHSGQQLERLILTLLGEAAASGNMILYLQDAHLFFGSGTGALDISQILLPIMRSHRVRIIAGFTPIDWQMLQTRQQALAGNFSSVVLTEPPIEDTFRIVEDSSRMLEHQSNVTVSFEAIREAYRISGQYMQEEAYPGKVIRLLEQALPYAQYNMLTAQSVQTAIEKTKGVKVSTAAAPEVDMLLNLEDRIHQRMINQKRAVSVISAALRRGRAGVSNPKRPVGSFLFLGPTGVGKTELARSLAAVYFGDEQQMIRLDMSEYQRPEDVGRLLAAGGEQEHSLLLSIRQQPFSVVLLDEVEKAHPSILNLLLQMLDEGQLTDAQGRPASFRSSIIIATSNAGAAEITARVKETGNVDNF